MHANTVFTLAVVFVVCLWLSDCTAERCDSKCLGKEGLMLRLSGKKICMLTFCRKCKTQRMLVDPCDKLSKKWKKVPKRKPTKMCKSKHEKMLGRTFKVFKVKKNAVQGKVCLEGKVENVVAYSINIWLSRKHKSDF